MESAPDLVVEILSPSTVERDLGVKQQMYARRGVDHYWVVDPDAETLAEYVLDENCDRLQATYKKNQSFEPVWLAGLRIDMSEVFGG